MKDEGAAGAARLLPFCFLILPPSSFNPHPWIPMLQFPPSEFRKRRGRTRRTPPTPPGPAALVLVAAMYGDSPTTIRLTFGRAINIAGLDGNQIVMDDGRFGVRYVATGPAALLDPATVEIELE